MQRVMPKTKRDLPGRLELRLAPDDKERFAEAAKRKGLSLSAWIRLACIETLERGGAGSTSSFPKTPRARKARSA
jgi:predicted HicB family RNase H-like nuclease